MCHSIRAQLDNNATLSAFQHDFRSGFSCDSQLLSTVHVDKILSSYIILHNVSGIAGNTLLVGYCP